VYFLRVQLRDDGLSAEGRSALDGRDARDLPTFLSYLVDRWRGWEGHAAVDVHGGRDDPRGNTSWP
jgi:hypothetical protein